MNHRIRIAAALAAGLAAVFIGSPAEADAVKDTRPCVTQEEFWDLEPGMTRLQVQAILDGPGSVFEDGTDERFIERRYPSCNLPFKRARVLVLYNRKTDELFEALKVRYYNGSGCHDAALVCQRG